MKKYILIIISLLGLFTPDNIFAQWFTGLNGPPSSGGLFLGTNYSYPLRIYTDNENRMQINQNLSYGVNSQAGITRNGYVGIGRNLTPTTIWNGPGPISLLHLNGDEGSVMGTQGYRNWMRNSITITSNNDLMFMGPRRRGAEDVTDAVIGWADNPAGPGVGPDNMLFVFSTGTGTGTDLDGGGADGREIMRMNANGNIGMGPRFNNTAQPQSQLHINAENVLPSWLQITNQSGTGQSATDGLRMGVSGTNAYIYNQENAHLIFSTNNNTGNLAGERMRLTHIGAAGTPATAANGSTRLGVSLNPASPLTEPRSLVHIGENTGGVVAGADGTRSWMDVGYLATFDSDNIYVGLKNEGADRKDAVVAWGDNQTNLVGNSGPDNLRFIFTNSQFFASPGTDAAKSENGQEIARFTPACAGCPVNTGSLGIGNFSPASPNAPGTANYVGSTLDVDGDARVRTVAQDNTLSQVLVRDPADLGRVKWRDASTLGVGGGGLGNDCGATPVPLTASREIPLAGNNFIFSGQHATDGRVGIGVSGCSPESKLEVRQTLGLNEKAIIGYNTAPMTGDDNGDLPFGIGVVGINEGAGDLTTCKSMSVGGFFLSSSTDAVNFGVYGLSLGQGTTCPSVDYGGYFVADNGTDMGNIGVYAQANTDLVPNMGGNWAAFINGDGYHSALWTASDQRLKHDVVQMKDMTSALMSLNPVTYSFMHDVAPSMNLPHGKQFGVLAQELEEVFPNLVKKTPVPKEVTQQGIQEQQGLQEISVVNYEGLIPVLIAAFQEQNERISQLQQQLDGCCNAPKSMQTGNEESEPTGAVIQTRLENGEEPSLGQNIPNPFESATRIPAFVPQNTRKAEIMFYGNDGKVLQILPINDRGSISVDVDSATLSAGVYSYTLFVDGKPVDTKRMVKR